MDWIRHDVRFALRALGRRPGFTALAVVTLAIGLGVNTVAFSAVNALLFRPLDFPGARTAGWLFVGSLREPHANASLPVFERIARHSVQLERVAAEGRVPVAFDNGRETNQIWALVVSPEYFAIVDPRPVAGRLLTAVDGRAEDVAVMLSERFWRREFAASTALGSLTVTINRRPARVVGVLSDGFQGPGGIFDPDVWVPLAARHAFSLPTRYDDPATDWLTLIARPATAANAASISREISQIVADAPLPVAGPDVAKGSEAGDLRVEFVPLVDRHPEARQIGKGAIAGLGAVGLVLLIACFNVAGLSIARVAERRHDLGVRSALGASRWRLARLTLTEGFLLAGGGAVAALLLGRWSATLLSVFSLPAPIPQRLHFATDWRVLAFIAAMALVAALLPALTPIAQMWRADLVRWLRSSGSAQTAGFAGRRARRLFVVLQVAGSTAFLTLALVFGANFLSQWQVDPGFDADRLAILELDPAQHSYSPTRSRDLAERLTSALRRSAGVEAVALTDRVSFFVGGPNVSLVSPDGRACRTADCPRAGRYVADSDFFRAMGIQMVAGRVYDSRGTADRNSVVISQTAARTLWPDHNSLGRTFRIEPAGPVVTVIGVAADIVHRSMQESAQPYFYRPPVDADFSGPFTVVVRTAGDPAAAISDIRRALRTIDPSLPPRSLQTMEERMALPLWMTRTTTGFFGICGILAVLLSTIGLFGVTYFAVNQRRREFGVRMALGASTRDVRRLVIVDALRLAWPGVVLGSVAAIGLGFVLRATIFGFASSAPLPYALGGTVQIIVSALAAWSPARRAGRSNPLEVLRAD